VNKRTYYLTWGVGLGAAALALFLAWRGEGGWGALAVIPVGTVVVGYGGRWGLAAGLFALGVGVAAGLSGPELLLLALALFLAGVAGAALRARFRSLVRRERRLKRSLALFNRALDEVVKKTEKEEVLKALPELLGGYMGAEAAVLAPGEKPPASDAGALSFPLKARERTVGVLWLTRPGGFDPLEEETLGRFAEAVSDHLTLIAEHTESRLVAELTRAVASADDLAEAARKALALLADFFQAGGAGLWRWQEGRFYPIAFHGRRLPAEERFYREGIPPGRGWLWRVYLGRRPIFVEDVAKEPAGDALFYHQGVRSLALHPVLGEHRGRAVLVLRSAEPRLWSEDERRLLAVVARVLGLMLRPYELKERLSTLLSLEHALPETSEDAFYREVLKAAVRLVPGAEAGSLLVRGEAGFSYRAAVGYDLKGLSTIHYSEEDLAGWCGPSWASGKPRLRSREGGELARLSLKSAPREVIDRAGRLSEIQQNLCVPIVYKGEVLAVLNLDAFSDPRAFDGESTEVAEAFAVQVAAMVHEAAHRRFLERAALTDPLTGLLNRRAFDQQLYAEFSRAERMGYPLALAVMDLTRFKEINDRFGHAAGDRALLRVAEALSGVLRGTDLLFRWGGDEFAVILPFTDREGALAAARRYAEAVRSVCLGGVCLGANVGVAVYPGDALDESELLKTADRRMYQAKSEGRVLQAD